MTPRSRARYDETCYPMAVSEFFADLLLWGGWVLVIGVLAYICKRLFFARRSK